MANGIANSEVRPECKERFKGIEDRFKFHDDRITGLHDKFKERLESMAERQMKFEDKFEKKIDNLVSKITTIYVVVLTQALAFVSGLILYIIKK